MDDKMKLAKLYTLLVDWQIMRDKLDLLLDNNQSDLLTTQYVLYASHAAELEAILNG